MLAIPPRKHVTRELCSPFPLRIYTMFFYFIERLMGQPLMPGNHLQQQYLALQNNLLRAQAGPLTSAGQVGGQVLISPRLATSAASSQHQAALMSSAGLAPPLVSSADLTAAGQTMLYTSSSLPSMMHAGQADLSQYGLMNQAALLDYQAAVDQSAAGMSTYQPPFTPHPQYSYVKSY